MMVVECQIDEDWIKIIERGLPFVGRAIKEDRQFIRNEGEVLPIEKIRKVSKDSVTDLAKHTDYITKLPDKPGDTLIPEKLLMVQRENEYAIYENRVLYAALSYLKDFIVTRLDRINEASNKYEGKCYLKKNVDLGYRSVDFLMSIKDVRKDDPIAIKKNKYHDLMDRLNSLLNDVILYLRTPLMVSVSKAPLVTRPITKTNILRMDHNFRESLLMFDCISGYNKPGYTITKSEKIIKPLPDDIQDDYIQIILLSSFLAYEYNNGIKDDLSAAFLLEEEKRKTIREDELLKRIASIKEKAKAKGQSLEQYVVLLEDGYAVLKERIGKAKEVLEKTIAEYEGKIDDINKAHEEETAKLNEKHEKEINDLEDVHSKEMDELKNQQAEEITKLKDSYQSQITELMANAEAEKAALVASHEKEVNSLSSDLEQARGDNKTLQDGKKATEEAMESLKKETSAQVEETNKRYDLAKAEAMTLRIGDKKGPDPDDFSDRERFMQLEAEKKVLDEFFERSWKETKKNIKKKIFDEYNPRKK